MLHQNPKAPYTFIVLNISEIWVILLYTATLSMCLGHSITGYVKQNEDTNVRNNLLDPFRNDFADLRA
jgi:hypothetical protein